MKTVKSPGSIRKQIIVEVPRKQAFEVFTGQMGACGTPTTYIGGEPFAQIVNEPHEGGAWYEVDESGTRCDWGRVLVWDDGDLLVHPVNEFRAVTGADEQPFDARTKEPAFDPRRGRPLYFLASMT